jgi:hypothetical protein
MEEEPHFVWTRGVGNKPSPSKWPDAPVRHCGRELRRKEDVFAAHKLKPDEFAMSLNELIELYPPPAVPQ